MGEMELGGWVKFHRRLLTSAVWRRGTYPCRLLWAWLLLVARHPAQDAVVRRCGKEYRLAPGELVASLADTATGARITAKEARSAYEWLERENMIVRDKSLVRVLNYHLYQGSADDDGLGEEGEVKKDAGDKPGQEIGQGNGQSGKGKMGMADRGEKILRHRGKRGHRDGDGARSDGGNGQGIGQGNGQGAGGKTGRALSSPSTRARAGEKQGEEVKENINPPTPFKKGGSDFDNSKILGSEAERVDMVLAMWREVWAEAGKPIAEGLEGDKDRRGAEEIVRRHLNNCGMSLDCLRQGMQKLCEWIRTDPKCRLLDLGSLAKNPRKYCPSPVIDRPKRRYVMWEFRCDVCGAVVATSAKPAGDGQPAEQDCVKSGRGCQGRMRPNIIQEWGDG